MSLSWYARFELGGIARVSDNLFAAVAGALRLDAAERDYLRALSHPLLVPAGPPDETVSEPLRFIVESFIAGPAAVFGSRLNPLVVNDVARRLELGVSRAGMTSSLAHSAFLDAGFQDKFIDWRERRREVVAMLRSLYARHVGERGYDDFIASMSERSPEFAREWAAQEVMPIRFEGLRIRIGGATVRFRSTLFSTDDAPGKAVVFLVPTEPDHFAQLIAEFT